jgi:putative hydrolase
MKSEIVIKADLHTHTIFSHGVGSIEDNVKSAISKGLKCIAITDHGPGHKFYGIKKGSFTKMRAICDLMNEKYPEITVLLGVEANIMNVEGDLDVDEHIIKLSDIILCGYHFGLGFRSMAGNLDYHVSNIMSNRSRSSHEKAILNNTKAMTGAMRKYDIKAMTHPGAKGPFDVQEVARVARETNTSLEINNHHGHLSVDEILAAKEQGCTFLISSDAHRPGDVGNFKRALERASIAGVEDHMVINSSFYYV